MTVMNSNRPYIIRALYEWILDNDDVPYVTVDCCMPDVLVPQDFVSEGIITLSIGSSAVKNLHMDNEAISFNARFGGVPMQVYVPILAVQAIVAKKSGQGMFFGMEADMSSAQSQSASGLTSVETNISDKSSSQSNNKKTKPKNEKKGPNLRVVK